MNKKIRWITETAVMLALLLCFQWVGSQIPEQYIKQLVTGSLVNCVLAVSVLYVGYGGGLAVAILSPIFAFWLGIAPNVLTVAPIMAGNSCFVVLLRLICGKTGKPFWRQLLAWLGAAGAKFGVLYLLVVWLMCNVFSSALIDAGAMKKPMVNMLSVNFGVIQLFTALLGGALALSIWPVLRKALKR